MTYTQLGDLFFTLYVGGCFTALVLSFKGNSDTRVLIQTFLIWISIVYIVTHFIYREPWAHWHEWWYLFNAAIAIFPAVCAKFLKDSYPRKPLMILSVLASLLCLVYFVPSYIYWEEAWDIRLPGIYYYAGSNALESLEVGALIVFSGPFIPVLHKMVSNIRNWRLPWTHQRLRA